MKRFALVLLALLTMLTGCQAAKKVALENSQANEETVLLEYYTIGWEDQDIGLVNAAMNDILLKEKNIQVNYHKLGWSEYDTKLKAILSSGTVADIVFAQDFISLAADDKLLPLGGYLGGDYHALYEVVNPLLWEGLRLWDGEIYGIPTNKEVAVHENWMYPKELVDKYNLDITKYNTLESLEPLFELISVNEPDYLVMELDNHAHDFFALYGYESLINTKMLLSVDIQQQELEVVNPFTTEDARTILAVLREYYQAGYINPDAALRQNQDLQYGQKTFWRQASGGILSDGVWSRDRGYAVVSHPVTPTIVNTRDTRDAVMAVIADTKHPKECLVFLQLLNTNPAFRNLVNYGIEGKHYKLTDDQRVEYLEQGYGGIQYTQGNWFILYPLATDPTNKWEQFKEKNKEATPSPLLGFTANVEEFEAETQMIQHIWEKYYPCLMTGSVDVEIELPKFLDELEQAGIENIRKSLQTQLDAWLKEKQEKTDKAENK